MRTLPLRLALFSASSLAIGTAVLIACSSDDNVITNNGTPDSSTPDNDSSTPTFDSGGSPDAGGDASPVSVPITLDNFAQLAAEVHCKSLARCCFGNANLDGGARVDGGAGVDAGYDQASCIANYRATGFASSNPPGGVDAGPLFVKLDQTAAASCLAKIAALSCGELSAADYKAARDTCHQVITGVGDAGAFCDDSVQCRTGHFCDKSLGGDAGKCDVLRGLDASCGDTTDPLLTPDNAAQFAEEACSYRGSGDTGNHCEFYDFLANDFAPQGEWKCAGGRANAEDCANTAWCQSAVCYAPTDNDTPTCLASEPYFNQDTCAIYVSPTH
jgi:hypothetical protein